MNFKQLREKSVKGISMPRYLENPTGSELYRLMMNSKYGEIRLLEFDGILYAWDADNMIHNHFIMRELLQNIPYNSEHHGDMFNGHISSDEMNATIIGRTLWDNHKKVIKDFMEMSEGDYQLMQHREKYFIWAYFEPEESLNESMDQPYEWTPTSEVSYTFHVDDPNNPMKQDIVDVDFNPDFNSSVEISFSMNDTSNPKDKTNSVMNISQMFATILDIIKYYDSNHGDDIQTYLLAGTSHKLTRLYMRMIMRYAPNTWKITEDSGIIFLRKP